MNTMMNNEIASERIRSRSHTPNAGRNRTPEVGSAGAGCDTGPSWFSDSVLGVSGMRLFDSIQFASGGRDCMTFLVALEVVGRIGVGVRRTFYGTLRWAGEPEFWVLPDGGRIRR